MKSRYIVVIPIILLSTFCIMHLYSDDLAQREKELSEVQSQLEEQRRRALEADAKKRTAEQSKRQMQNQLTIAQRRSQELSTVVQNLRSSLDHSKSLLSQTESKISVLQFSCNETMLHLLLADQAQTKLKQPENDTYLLSTFMRRLIVENRKLTIEKIKISSETLSKEEEYTKSESLSSTEMSRLDTISTNLRQIDTEITNLEKQKADFQKQANELEKSAVALQNLINLLKNEAKTYQYTYSFPNGIEPPVKGRLITAFGPKKHERYDISTFSNGIDVAVPENTVIKALSDGEVVYADWFTGAGRMIIIDHKNGYHTIYSYINTMYVNKGDSVRRGQAIAESGKLSTAPEPSLHFEIRKNGIPENPLNYININ